MYFILVIMNFNPKPVKQIWIEYRFNNTFMEATSGQADIQIIQIGQIVRFVDNEQKGECYAITYR